jgi:hypothetical protein
MIDPILAGIAAIILASLLGMAALVYAEKQGKQK